MFFNILSQQGFFILIGVFVFGSAASLIWRKNGHFANLCANYFAALGSAMGILFSSEALLSEGKLVFKISNIFSFFPVSVEISQLSAFFILIISTVSLLSSVYAVGYMRQFYKKYDLGIFGFFYNIFIASMILVVTANNALYFLFVWEIMSLASYFLVIFEKDHGENTEAGFLYFVMTHLATCGIFLAFLLLYGSTGSFDFETIRMQSGSISSFIIAISSILLFAGFGTKAGIIPFHIWLPKAHPAAPSQVSALMSGVMIKTGIFMIIRLFFDVLPGTPLWFGFLVLFAGSTSSLLGVLYALGEHDLKRLLAYHSVENIGIILMGTGSALIFLSLGLKPLAFIAIIASLYHTMNHAIFKALLFLGAGSLAKATGTRNIEEYGGLIKSMPYTALFFLMGSMAISALPPFNGFISEWLTFQALFAGIGQFDMFTRSFFIFAIVSLALTGGLAAACFVKAFGISFLAKPRSHGAENAKESGIEMRFGMGILAALCLLLGVSAGFVVSCLESVAGGLAVFSGDTVAGIVLAGGGIQLRDNFSSLGIMQIFIVLAIVIGGSYLIFNYVSRRQKEKIYNTWDCGANLTPRMEITATSFSRSIISIFGGILKPTKQIEIEYHDADIRYFTKSSTVILGMGNLYQKYLYGPVFDFMLKLANRVRQIQGGNINLYLLYIFITIISLLIWVTQ